MELNKPRSQLERRTPDGISISRQAANQRVTPVRHGNPNFPCKTCTRTFNTQGAANDHMRGAGHDKPNISCKSCARKFYTQSAANEHRRAVEHGSPSISCKTCTRTFNTQGAANDHMRAAGHDKPNISCKRCAKKFHTQSAANQHMTATKHGSPTTASHTHGFSNKIWSSTGKGSEVITDATDHTTQDSAFEPPNEARKTSSPELSLARTIYAPSATLTTPARGDKRYIGELAEQLFGVVNCPGLTRDALDRVSRLLPDLLRAFAVQVGYQAPSPMHRDVMFYVRKDRM
jgi:RNase P subunit RPR2